MSTVTELEQAFKTAKKAWKANKEDKSLKKAFKAAKAAFEAAKTAGDAAPATEEKKNNKRKAEDEAEVPAKKPKVDIEALKAAVKAAKKANKAAGKTPETKAALKAAKKALEEAEGAAATETPAAEEPAAEEAAAEEAAAEEPAAEEPAAEDALAGLKKPKPADPNACERLFCGNLSWDIDDDAIKEFFKDCGTINDIYWLEDRDTGKFKGCGFISFDTVEMGIKAMELNGQEVLGREIKLDYSPRNNRQSGGKGGKGGKGKGGKGARELSEKPEGCTTVFCGNLSFDIDDDKMSEFAKEAGCGEIKAIRWLTDRDSGDFKGCGFVEFYESDSVDAFVKKNGEDLLGRSIRVDYSKPREKKW